MKKTTLISLLILLTLPFSKGYAQYSTPSITSDSIVPKKSQRLNPGLCKEVFSLKNLAVFGAGLGGAFLLDEWVSERLQANQSSPLKAYTDVATFFGEKKIMAPATLATWGLGLALKDERLSQTALNSGKALITGALLAESIKIIAGRSRPDMHRGNMHFDAFGGTENSTKSFPSGHAFVAWSIFTPFAQEYSKWIYVIPASVSFARMYRNRHWFSDVVLGSGIGYFAGLYFHKRKNQRVLFNGNGIVIKF